MDYYSSGISRLIEELGKLPGVGPKSAQRLAFHIINMPEEAVDRLASSITEAKHSVCYCKKCCTLTDQELCPICSSTSRDTSTIMVVENPRDLAAYEKTGRYNGLYHVLHGAISPALGIGPGDIRLKELMPAPSERTGFRADCRHEFQPGGRDNGNVYQQAGEADRDTRDPHCQRCAGRW